MLWLSFLGCGLLGGGEELSTCDLKLDNLAGTTWVVLQAKPDKSVVPNPQARLRFEQKGEELLAKYSVMSVSDVYDYPCTMREKDGVPELFCAEEQRIEDWCQSLLVVDELCTKKRLRKMGAEGTDDELNAKIITAKETVRKYRDTPQWPQFKLNNNNVGNKLQGRLYVSVDERNCQLSVGDFYWTIFNGREIEDTNPVGQNPFTKGDPDLMFEHCTDGQYIAPLPSTEVPEDLSAYQRPEKLEKGTPVHYTYLRPEATQKAEEGCTYSMDTYARWKPAQSGLPVKADADGKLTWQATHTWSDADIHELGNRKVGVFTMVRHKECGGKKEKIDVVCDMAVVD